MPRHPKPAPLRANTERLDVGILTVRGPTPAPPDPPAGLSPLIRSAWQSYWRSPLARIASMETDLPALRRLFILYEERERSLRVFRRQPEVTGSMGQKRINPAINAISESDILALEDRFGLNPRARLTLGVILGDAARSLADLNADLAPDDDEPGPDLFDGMDGTDRGVPPAAVPVTPETEA